MTSQRGTGDTIAAIATPPGEGAIAVVRVSGGEALVLADRVFRGGVVLALAQGHTVHFGRVVSRAGEEVDEVLATVFREPRSYTGEDTVEFSCHGGVLVTHRVLEVLLDAGARHAAPGEFTRRAFLNGKMDLSQAEAVADLIAATSLRAAQASMEHLEGKLGKRVGVLRKNLLDLCALLELDLDFAEEGLDVIPQGAAESRLEKVRAELRSLIDSYSVGRVYREGVSVAIVGRPNAGKSSLFNALLKEERAIVTEIPGTTRDALHESITVNGILFRLTDTAGLRDTGDRVEQLGVERSRSVLRGADLILLVIDQSLDLGMEIPMADLGALSPAQSLIIVQNKMDLCVGSHFPAEKPAGSARAVDVSALTGEGVASVLEAMVQAVADVKGRGETTLFVTNRRHRDALEHASQCMENALASSRAGRSNELVAFEVREGANSLAEITGEVTTDEILNTVFARFCIGK
jgi:tRNA modification GTPase